jgi:hypothetical protein
MQEATILIYHTIPSRTIPRSAKFTMEDEEFDEEELSSDSDNGEEGLHNAASDNDASSEDELYGASIISDGAAYEGELGEAPDATAEDELYGTTLGAADAPTEDELYSATHGAADEADDELYGAVLGAADTTADEELYGDLSDVKTELPSAFALEKLLQARAASPSVPFPAPTPLCGVEDVPRRNMYECALQAEQSEATELEARLASLREEYGTRRQQVGGID